VPTELVGAARVERGPFRVPGSLRSPMLSGRALRALSAKRPTHPAKRPTETPFPKGGAPAPPP